MTIIIEIFYNLNNGHKNLQWYLKIEQSVTLREYKWIN